jgi:hypothetical protein
VTAFALVASPYSAAPAIKLGNQAWRKRVLPVGEVAYKGRMLRFTRGYLRELASAFCDGAYDQVPFQIADVANSRTNPEQFRGEVTGMDVPRSIRATRLPRLPGCASYRRRCAHGPSGTPGAPRPAA